LNERIISAIRRSDLIQPGNRWRTAIREKRKQAVTMRRYRLLTIPTPYQVRRALLA
jgi:hypothetical protein